MSGLTTDIPQFVAGRFIKKMIEVNCSNDALKNSFKWLIKYFGGSPPLNNGSTMTLHIILQNDLDLTRGKLLDKLNISEDEIKKSRFIFLRLDDNHNQKYQFWEKIIGNICLGRTLNIKAIINNKKEEGKDRDKGVGVSASIVDSIKELCNENTTDSKFAYSVLNKLICLQERLRTENDNFKVRYIDEIDSHEITLHEQEEKKMLFYSYLRSAILDWSKQNDWVLRTDYYEGDFNFLIIDDLMWKKEWPEKKSRENDFINDLEKCIEIAEELTGRKWNVYRLLESEDFKDNFKENIERILEKNEPPNCKPVFKGNTRDNEVSLLLTNFTHILIDWRLDKSSHYTGLNLVRDIKTWIDRNKNSEDMKVIPELLILSRSHDPATVQSALNAGASGYIVKDDIAALPYIVGRAGRPLKVKEAEKIFSLLSDNFPSLKSFPAFVQKALYFDKWKKIKALELNGVQAEQRDNDYENYCKVREHRSWLRSIPKADLHVHFGTAIPLNVCYDLALISVYRWACQYNTGNKDKWKQLTSASKLIGTILSAAVNKLKVEGNRGDKFRELYLNSFKKTTKIYEVATVNNTIKRLNRRFDKISEEVIACLVVANLGFLYGIYEEDTICKRIIEIINICDDLKNNTGNNQLLYSYLQDASRLINDIQNYYKTIQANKIIKCTKTLIGLNKSNNLTFDPLSSLLSIPNTLQGRAEGLPKYLGAGDLVGASLLQFAETLLLASYHIPKWAAEQNVWHQELRAGPTGYLKGLGNSTIATKIMMLGLFMGIKKIQEETKKNKRNTYLTTSVLITAKRHKKKEDIKESVLLATHFVTKNEKDIENKESKEFLPLVLGMDLAGIERGYLPEDLVEHFMDSFKKCLMMTVHAGEDESVESVWQAVYTLHASRVGHGLRLNEHPELKRLFRDRQLCVELCPKSNQYTNGYIQGKNDYVLESYKKDNIPLSINTDNPLLSHRPTDRVLDYPLSEEYMILPHLVSKEYINRLLILELIYNGFKCSFLDPKEKARLIECADTEVFNILAEEFLDVYVGCVSK